MKLTYSYDKYLIIINNKITRKMFLDASGAGKGFSFNFFNKIYNCIFSEKINVEEEYEKYYSIEFENIWQYLFKKYNISDENINVIKELKKQDTNNTIYKKENSNLWLEHFIFSESMYEKIINLLLMRKTTNENKI